MITVPFFTRNPDFTNLPRFSGAAASKTSLIDNSTKLSRDVGVTEWQRLFEPKINIGKKWVK